jgi:subtilisin family serine protease
LPLPSAEELTGELATGVRRDIDIPRPEDLRLLRLRELLRANPRLLERDEQGAPVVRGEVLAVSPTQRSLQIALAAGFVIARRESLAPLDLEEVVLTPPSGQSAREAVRRLRKLDPDGRYDFDHIYSSSGTAAPAGPAPAVPGKAHDAARVRVGLLDTGVERSHASLANAAIEQRAFAPGGVKVDAHGTAVASLLVGRDGRFVGAAPGAHLFAGDVYGPGPTGGSADAIARGLAWMASNGVGVINVSLVGPPNQVLEAAVKAVTARGELVVAPVGNDGPAAPPLYPASYGGVVAVTAVDARGRVIFEAGRARHVDFAAPGADMLAARAGGGLAAVRGTSFAAPIVAGRLALLQPRADPATATGAIADLAREARRPAAGDASRLGRGVVGEALRLDPRTQR